jgi:hypothetical protein
MRDRHLLVAMLGGLLVSAGAEAQAPPQTSGAALDTKGAVVCSVAGYAIDRDPKGSNLRAAPRADAPIIGHVPPLYHVGDEFWTGTALKIVGSKDGWLLVYDDAPNPEMTFDAAHQSDRRGWLSARLVSTSLRFPPLRSAPRRDAPLVARLAGDGWGPDSLTGTTVHGCQGDYIEVTAIPIEKAATARRKTIGGKPVRGWSYKGCSVQLTTCDSGGMTE